MAKGQKRSGREVKKPKAKKPPVALAGSGSSNLPRPGPSKGAGK